MSSFGPNTFPAHNSALFAIEVQISYVARTLLAPLIDHRFSTFEVKSTAENQWVNSIHQQLQGSVFDAGCSNWYINEYGRNAASWPGYASMFWKETLMPRFGVFNKTGGDSWWMIRRIWRWMRTMSRWMQGLGVLCILVSLVRRGINIRMVIRITKQNILSRANGMILR